MSSQRKIDVHDRVSSTHPPIDHRPRSEAIDDPDVLVRPGFQRLRDRVKRCAPPAGEPLHFVDFMHGYAEMSTQRPRESRLAATSVSDDRNAPHRTIVTRKRERGPPPSRV